MAGQLEKSCGYLDWRLFAGAVLKVFQENSESKTSKYAANADVWATYSGLRGEIFDRTRSHWCQMADLDSTWFPYSEDAVARMYFRFRKRNDDEIVSFSREISGGGLF